MRALALAAVVAVAAAGTAWAQAYSLYVATTGSDGNAGTSPSAPFATVARAQLAVQAWKQAHGGGLPGPVTVNIAPGTYFLANTWALTPADSGTAAYPVTYLGPGAVLSGGSLVTPQAVGGVASFAPPAGVPIPGADTLVRSLCVDRAGWVGCGAEGAAGRSGGGG
jgi:hypothetical protein